MHSIVYKINIHTITWTQQYSYTLLVYTHVIYKHHSYTYIYTYLFLVLLLLHLLVAPDLAVHAAHRHDQVRVVATDLDIEGGGEKCI